MTQNFELVLEGLGDGSGETLRKIKGALLGDLGLSIAEAQAILEALPHTLCCAATPEELRSWHTSLSRAGAQVAIVRPIAPESALGIEPIVASDLFAAPSGETQAAPQPTGDTTVIESGLDFVLQPITDIPPQPSAPLPPSTEVEFSLELSPPEQTLPLKEDLVPAENHPAPSEPSLAVETAPTEATVSSSEAIATLRIESPPSSPEELTLVEAELPPVAPASESSPAEAARLSPPSPADSGKSTGLGTGHTEHTAHIPLGRQKRSEPSPKNNVSTPINEAPLERQDSSPVLTPELIIVVSATTIALAVVNWLYVLR